MPARHYRITVAGKGMLGHTWVMRDALTPIKVDNKVKQKNGGKFTWHVLQV